MRSLLSLFIDIALLRRGPDSAPGTPAALAIAVVLYAGLASALMLIFRLDDHWVARLIVGIVFTLGWYWVLLTFGGKPERFTQTAVAVLGYQAMLLPLSLAVQWWFIQADTAKESTTIPQLLFLLVLAWSLAVNTRIVRAALEWPVLAAGAVVLAEFFTGLLLLAAMFGTDANR